MARDRHSVASAFEVNQEAGVLGCYVPCLDNFGLFNELFQLSNAAERGECRVAIQAQQNTKHKTQKTNNKQPTPIPLPTHTHLNRLISFFLLLLKLFSSGADGGSGALLWLLSKRSTSSPGCDM